MAGLWDFKPASTPARFDTRETEQSLPFDRQSSSKLRDFQPSSSPFGSERKASGWHLNGTILNKAAGVTALSRYQSASHSEDAPSVQAESNSSQEFLNRYQQLKALDSYKNTLIEDLIYRNERLEADFKRLRDDHEREFEVSRTIQRRETTLIESNRRLQLCMDRDPFALVLIDGDGMIFRDELLMRGDAGGKEAASILHDQVYHHLISSIKDFPLNTKIVARVYANVKGLSDACYRGALVDRASKVEDFVRGFTRSRMLFDWVDVGKGKDCADDKLSEIFKLHLHDYHCRQILLGCSHDNGYARLLENLGTEEYVTSRVTLLEGVPFEKELRALPFNSMKFESLFRDRKINIYANPPSALTAVPNNIMFGTPSPPLSRQLSQVSLADVKDFTPSKAPLSRVVSIAASNSTPGASPSLTWASAAAKTFVPVAPPPAGTPTGSGSPDPTQVPRNRKGQRVDPIMKHDKAEVDRVKKLKLCNVHFLRGSCPYGDDCTHIHQYRPTSAELQTLRLVARMAPCVHGTECEDLKCIYGHICPAPEGRDGRACIFGDQCRFLPELHNIDRQVVKMIKV